MPRLKIKVGARSVTPHPRFRVTTNAATTIDENTAAGELHNGIAAPDLAANELHHLQLFYTTNGGVPGLPRQSDGTYRFNVFMPDEDDLTIPDIIDGDGFIHRDPFILQRLDRSPFTERYTSAPAGPNNNDTADLNLFIGAHNYATLQLTIGTGPGPESTINIPTEFIPNQGTSNTPQLIHSMRVATYDISIMHKAMDNSINATINAQTPRITAARLVGRRRNSLEAYNQAVADGRQFTAPR